MESALFGLAGGLLIKLLELSELYKVDKKERPDFADWLYWFPYIFNPLLGAALAFVYVKSGIELEPILAFNVGVSAPLIIRTMATSIPLAKPTIDPGPGA